MSKPLPPLNWFRAFESSARLLSFTAAAAEIGMTQSAVSQQIRALETRLRVVLFERRARGLALTDEGRKLLPQVEAALEQLIAATDQFDLAPSQTELIVRASISMIEWVISPNLGEFHRAHPGVSIRFMTAIWPDEFSAARVDIEIRFGSRKQAGLDAQPVLPNDLIALKSPELHGDIRDLPLIEAVGTSSGWSDWGKAAGIAGLKPSVFVDSYGLALRLAADGNGVALVSSALTRNVLRSGSLITANPTAIPGKEGYFLSLLRPSAPAVAFCDWLTAQ